MNYGKSAYTKVIELEKRFGLTNDAVKIFDSGKMSAFKFSYSYEFSKDKILFCKNQTYYSKISFNALVKEKTEINIDCYFDDVLVNQKTVDLIPDQNNNIIFDWTGQYDNSSSVLPKDLPNLQSNFHLRYRDVPVPLYGVFQPAPLPQSLQIFRVLSP